MVSRPHYMFKHHSHTYIKKDILKLIKILIDRFEINLKLLGKSAMFETGQRWQNVWTFSLILLY